MTLVVKGIDGKPVPGVTVETEWYLGEVGLCVSYAATNSSGELVVEGLYKGGIYRPHVNIKGFYAPWDVPPVGGKGWTGNVEIKLEPANRTQVGIVVDEFGHPVANAQVVAYMSGWPQAKTGPDGRFTIEGLPDSQVDLRAYTSSPMRCGSTTASRSTPEVRIILKKSGC